eukprot:6187062-Pleurochrysis_carterae.AAC.1
MSGTSSIRVLRSGLARVCLPLVAGSVRGGVLRSSRTRILRSHSRAWAQRLHASRRAADPLVWRAILSAG